MLYRVHLAIRWILTTLVVRGIDCIGSCKSNYHTITTFPDCIYNMYVFDNNCRSCQVLIFFSSLLFYFLSKYLKVVCFSFIQLYILSRPSFILLYPPQTKFGGVYRNHPVRPSVHVPCKRNSS